MYACGPKERHLKMLWSLVNKKEDCTNSRDIQRQPLSMRPLAQVNHGIGGFLMSTKNHNPM